MTLAKIVSFVEDGPWGGTGFPGFNPPRRGQSSRGFGNHLAGEVALNVQSLPPLGETGSFLWQAIRLHQYGQQLDGSKSTAEIGQGVFASAQSLYEDGQCGSVPWQVLLQWLRHPPPPPPPWLELVGQAVGCAIVGARMGGELGKQMQSAASALISDHLGIRNDS